MNMTDLNQQIADLLANVPDTQRQAAAALLAQYGPRLFEMAQADAWQYLRRLMAGDIEVVAELDSKLSNDDSSPRSRPTPPAGRPSPSTTRSART